MRAALMQDSLFDSEQKQNSSMGTAVRRDCEWAVGFPIRVT